MAALVNKWSLARFILKTCRPENQLEQIVAELNRATPGGHCLKLGVMQTFHPGDLASLDAVLNEAARRGASDLLLIADVPVTPTRRAVRCLTSPRRSRHSSRPESLRGDLLLPLMTLAAEPGTGT